MIFPLIVIPKRFERLTHALEGRCSIQLSYGTYLFVQNRVVTPFACAKIVRFFRCAKDFLLFFVLTAKWWMARCPVLTQNLESSHSSCEL